MNPEHVVEACAGQCCAVFYFPRTPREIKAIIEEEGSYNGLDGMMVADMLVPLSSDEVDERIERFELNPEAFELPGGTRTAKLYTCKHWDEETRLCTVWDHRPDLCSKYPYSRECKHCHTVGGCAYGQPAVDNKPGDTT